MSLGLHNDHFENSEPASLLFQRFEHLIAPECRSTDEDIQAWSQSFLILQEDPSDSERIPKFINAIQGIRKKYDLTPEVFRKKMAIASELVYLFCPVGDAKDLAIYLFQIEHLVASEKFFSKDEWNECSFQNLKKHRNMKRMSAIASMKPSLKKNIYYCINLLVASLCLFSVLEEDTLFPLYLSYELSQKQNHGSAFFRFAQGDHADRNVFKIIAPYCAPFVDQEIFSMAIQSDRPYSFAVWIKTLKHCNPRWVNDFRLL